MGKFTKVLSTVALLFTLLFSNSAKASHFKGGDIYFECVGNGVYKLVFNCYYSCETFSSTPYPPSQIQWTLTSSCPSVPTTLTASSSSSSTAVDVPLYCHNILTTCDYPYSSQAPPPGTPDGTLIVQYVSDTFSIPAGCTVSAEITQGNRNAAISNLQNPSGTYIDIVASVTTPANNTCQSNPQFANFPVNIFCIGENANFSQGALDFSGDSITYTLINPRDFGGNPIPFVAGCSATNPLGAPNTFASTFTFDNATGNVNFTPTQSGNYVMAMQVNAYKNGVLVSTTMRDIQIVVINCVSQDNPPHLVNFFDSASVTGGIVYDSTHVGVCPGSLLQFTLKATDQDSLNYVKDSANFAQILPGSIIFVTHTGTTFDTATLHVTWTPQNSDSGYHYIFLTVSDTFCPRPGMRTYPFVVSVLTGLYAGANQVYCNGGQPVTISAHGANHYIWTDSATGGPPIGVISYSPDSSSITVAPPSNTGYIVHGDLLGSCKNIDTVTIFNAPIYTLATHAQDSAICKYTTTVISVTATPSSVGPFTYSWTPAANVVSPAAATTTIKPLLNDTWFHVRASSVGGCVISDSVKVSISGAAPRLSILPSNNNVCPGDTVTLYGTAFAENLVTCGLVDTCPDNTILSSQSVGSDLSSVTAIETPYSGFYPAARTQYLITAAEMNAAGLSSGAITDISFYVSQLNSTLGYDSFTVSMGCTSLDSLRGFVNNLQEVAPSVQVFPNLGWSPHPFTHFYNWDGYSNLVVQVCYTRTSTNFDNDDYVAYNPTAYNGSVVYSRDFGSGANGCSLNAPTLSNNRPNIKIGMCSPNVLTYQWTPATLLCDTCAITQVIVRSDSTYTLTVRDNNCVNDSSVKITINKNIAIHALPDTTLCSHDTVALNVILSNPPPSLCLPNYNVTSIPYSAIPGAGFLVPGSDYFDASGNNSQDDATAGPYNIGFNFPFYCQSYNQFWVNSNGWISFVNPYPATTAAQERTAQTLPPSAADMNPQKMIVLMMGDYYLSPGGAGNIKYFVSGTAPNRVFVVQFIGMQEFFTAGVTTSGEMHMYEGSGVIDILIQSSNYTGVNHTTGIKETTGIGVAAPGRNNAPYTVSTPEAWRFTPQNGPSVVLGPTVWSPNISLSNDSIVNPRAYPSSTQTYYVDETLTINQFTNPTTCHVRDSVKITTTSFSHHVTASPVIICPGDTSRLTFVSANSISNYSWTPASQLTGATTADPLATVYDTTRFYVVATDISGCRGYDTVTVNVYPTQHPVINPDTAICYSDSVLLHVNGSYSNYQWYMIDTTTGAHVPVSTNSTLIVHPSGYYIVRVKVPSATCFYFSDTVHVDSFTRQHLYVISSGPDSFCTGGNVVLQTTQGLNNYQWTPAGGGAQAVPVQTSGDYSYTAFDLHHCSLFSDTAHIRVTDPPSITYNNYKPTLCPTDTDLIIVTTTPAGVPVFWSLNGAQIATGDSLVTYIAGNYTVVASLGCPDTSTFVLTGAASPVVTLDHTGPISACACDTSITVAAIVNPASASDIYTWSADSSHGSTYAIDSSGTYRVTVSDVNHCTATTGISATLTCPRVVVSATLNTIFPSDTTILSAIPAGGSVLTAYQWTPSGYILDSTASSTGATAQHPGTDTFYVKVTDNNGCTNTVPILITVVEQGNFKMATAFTPNGDGKNDNFYPVLNGPNSSSKVISFRIYNRWGQLVYNNPNAPGWDGGYGGTPQATDTYVYFVTVESPDPNDATKRIQKSVEGSFQLFR